MVWHLDVDLLHPGVEEDSKGLTVRQVKQYMSWVKYDVNQYGFNLLIMIN